MCEGQGGAAGEKLTNSREDCYYWWIRRKSVCMCVSRRKAIRDKNRQIKKGGVLKSLEAEDKKHELAAMKPEGIERGMNDVVRTDKEYNPQIGEGRREFNDALSLDKLRKHKLAEQPLLPKTS